jgi:phospholipase C
MWRLLAPGVLFMVAGVAGVAGVAAVAGLAGCGNTSHMTGACDGPCPQSLVRHLIVVVQENHTFDNHFGRYCQAAAAPDCTEGPACCEAGPDVEPGGASPVNLDDAAHASHDPDHSRACELEEMNGGKMDGYVTAACGGAGNFAYSDPQIIQPYWTLAASGALADRFFQPLAGASSANDMYLSLAHWAFDDNQYGPNAIGHECSFIPRQMDFGAPSLPDLLADAGVSWAWYAEGYQAMKTARANLECPEVPDECGFTLPVYPCVYDPADNPFQYNPRFRDDPKFFRDLSQLDADLAGGALPQVVFIKAIGYHSEHPGLGTKLSAGVAFGSALVQRLLASPYGGDSLVLLTYDEGGGYFDHVAPPASPDGQPYGTRIPLIAAGRFARTNYVSHVTMELTSIVKFIEWNWLGATGQLGARDALVANLGSLLDPPLAVPED